MNVCNCVIVVQQSLFGFGPSASAEIALTNVAGRIAKTLESAEGASSGSGAPATQHLFVYSNGEDVVGEAKVVVPSGKKVEHLGIKVELKGVVGTPQHDPVGAASLFFETSNIASLLQSFLATGVVVMSSCLW